MVKGIKDFINSQVRKQKGTFENDWGKQISEFGVYGTTVKEFVYSSDTKKRYIHIYYSAAKAAGERTRFEEKIQEMQKFLDRHRDEDREFGKAFEHYFYLHRNEKNNQLEQKLRILDDFLYEKGLHEEACEYVMQRLEALEELPFE